MSRRRDPRIPVEVVVSRRRHIRGSKFGASKLLVPKGEVGEGRMCCLGFAARKAGLLVSEISNQGDYHGLKSKLQTRLQKVFPKLFYSYNHVSIPNDEHDQLVAANDDPGISDENREELLTRIGLRASIKFIFVP